MGIEISCVGPGGILALPWACGNADILRMGSNSWAGSDASGRTFHSK